MLKGKKGGFYTTQNKRKKQNTKKFLTLAY